MREGESGNSTHTRKNIQEVDNRSVPQRNHSVAAVLEDGCQLCDRLSSASTDCVGKCRSGWTDHPGSYHGRKATNIIFSGSSPLSLPKICTESFSSNNVLTMFTCRQWRAGVRLVQEGEERSAESDWRRS